MCGIAGFNWGGKELGEKMGSCLEHRGPDDSGVFADDGVTLSHRRLSIIDLSKSASQPMRDNDDELVIVFNGEIYNFKELREELSLWYMFKTKSDTEVILAGYKKWGKEVVEKLNGIFSFAIWDRKKQELFCARDYMGVKPFYYFFDGERFIFASEIKSILEHDIKRELDLEVFNQFMRVLYAPEPKTLIKGINKLPPGHSLTLQGKKLIVDKFYEPSLDTKDISYKEALSQVRRGVEQAVERQLVADVPVGVYLSGGIDSSAVLASVAKVRKNIKTFSVGFELSDDEEREKFNKDFELAESTAKYFGAEHHPLILSVEDIANNLEEVIGSIDDPISNPTSIPMALLSKFAKREVTVVLSGNGGDELFGGYERYRMSRRVDIIGQVPWVKNFLPKKIKGALQMSALERLAQFEFEKDKRLSRVVSRDIFKPMSSVSKYFAKYVDSSLDKTDTLMLADIRSWLPDQALSLGDKMSMQGSLEERVPLLDREVVDLAMSLPLHFKVTPFGTKKILKDAFRGVLPQELFKEPKRGWFSPGAKWIRREEIQKIFKKVLSPDYYASTESVFDWSEVSKMLEDHISKKEYNLTILWAILTFQIWAKKYSISLPQ